MTGVEPTGSSQGRVIWITGLSATGKTTLAARSVALLRCAGVQAALLDGDEVRRAVGDEACGYDLDSRLVNAYRISRLAGMLASQGIVCVVATMSLFHAVHAFNREHLPGYFEIYLKVPLEERRRRDPKGLYAMAEEGRMSHMASLDQGYEKPLAPHMTIENTDSPMILDKVCSRLLREAGLTVQGRPSSFSG